MIFTFLHEFPNVSAHEDLIYSVKHNRVVSPTQTVQLTPNCNPNDIAISGGWEGGAKFFSIGANKANVFNSNTEPNSWLIELRNIDSIQHEVNGTVLCLKSLNPDSSILQRESGITAIMAPGQSAIVQANCASGEVAISGGVWNHKHEETQIFIDSFGPNVYDSFSTPTGWIAGVKNIGNSTAHVQSLVMCMKTQEKNPVILRVDEKKDFVSDVKLEKKCRINETIVGGGFYLGSKDVDIQSSIPPETMHEAGWKTQFSNSELPTIVQSYSMCMKTSELDENKFDLKLNSGTISLSTPLIQPDKIVVPTGTANVFFFIQTHNILDSAEQQNLKTRGITIMDSLNGFVYVASAPSNVLSSFSPLQFPEIRSIFPILPEYKQSSNVANKIVPLWAKFSGTVVLPDPDNDGFIHQIDLCPFQPETFNGFMDKDGCPDTVPGSGPIISDSDGDGISDSLDLCLTQTETFNGFQDLDGCSDVPPPSAEQAKFMIYFYDQSSDMRQIIESNGGTVISIIENINATSALMTFDQISNLANHNAVRYINYIDPSLESEITIAKETAYVSPLSESPYHLTGKGVTAFVYDSAPAFIHADFGDRMTVFGPHNAFASDISHATHVSGILGGGGTQNKGIAPEVTILSTGIGSINSDPDFLFDNTGHLQDKFVEAHGNNSHIDLANISMGHKVNKNNLPCNQHGNYTNTSVTLDELVLHRFIGATDGLIIVNAGGNERAYDRCNNVDSYHVDDFGTVNSPATAKNTIAVGSIDTNSNGNDKKLSGFSSFGPTDDGRIKPDLVAPGCHLWIAINNVDNDGISSTIAGSPGTLYGKSCGTSMAAPFVGGLVALMVDQWKPHFPDESLSPHTAKAILIHTAHDLGRPGPDYEFGWGMVNGTSAIDLIRDAKLIHNTITESNTAGPIIISDSINAGNHNKIYKIKSLSGHDLKFTLVWDDPPANIETVEAHEILINNLDLTVTNPSNADLKPQSLDPHNPRLDASVDNYDKVNNVEMIKSFGEIGEWTVQVSGTIPEDQDYTIIVSEQNFQNISDNEPVNVIVSSNPIGNKLEINITFKTNNGMNANHVTYDIKATQKGGIVLNESSHTHDGTNIHMTNTLSQHASSSAPVDIIITFKGFGGVSGEDPLTGQSQVISTKVVPEFGTITIMILVIAIISIIVVSSKSRLGIMYKV